MQDEAKTKEQLITELKALRQLVAELEKGKGASADPTELRRRAEKLSKARQTETGRSKTNDAERLCQELEIQQIELEMQNHELRNVLVQIEESRTRYSDLYDFAPVGYLTLDENGLVLEANLTFARQLGVERSCLVGSPLSVYIVLPDRNEFRSHLGSVLKYKTHQACEVRFMKGGGGDFHAMLDTISVEDAVGQRRVRTSVTDITERKRGEAALVESEDRFKLLYEQAPLAYQSLDENGNLIEVNPTWLEALGYAKEDVIGRNIADFLHPDWVNHFKESFPRFKAVGEVLGVEFEMVKKDGSTMRVSFHGKIGRDSQGRFKQTHCIFHDITERVKQAREIEYLNRLYSVLSRVSQAVVRATSPETFLDQACREVVESGGFLEAWIGEEEPMTSAVVPTAFWGGIGEYVRGITVYADSRAEGRGLTGTCIREHRPVVHNDFLHDPQTLPWRDRAASFGIASGAAFPIERGGQAWGALTIYSDEVDRFGGEDVKLLEKVAGDIEFALDNLDRELRRKQAEEELKSAFRKIDLILNAAGEGIVGLDENGTVTFVNPAAGQMLGYEEEELIGKDLHPMIHHSFPDGTRYPVTECPMWQCLRSGASSRVRDEVLWKKDGTSFPAAYSTTPIMGNGRVAGAVVTFRDISVRKRAEEALLESENKFKSFAEQALAGIYILQDGVFKYVNPKFAQMFGYTVDECLNDMHFQNLVYSEDLATVEEQVRRRTSGETKSVHYTFRGLKKNGHIFHAEVYGATSVYKGKPARAGTMVDITERKLAEAALKDSETQFRTLVESAPDAIFILVEGRFFVYANDAAVRLYGAASEKELLG
ncbi:MAG: PAS domain S-box protein, partial [Syntrophobacteraceae bacterium]